jgi:peptidoglycan/LPS O-acetylase OafA/YrhL
MRAVAATGGFTNIVVIVVCVIVHLTVGYAPIWMKYYIPMGALIAAYMYPLGMIVGYLWPRVVAPRISGAGFAGILLFSICIYLSMKSGVKINIGKIKLYSIDDMKSLLLCDIYILSSFLAIAKISTILVRVKLLEICGKFSLVIYIMHSIIFQFLLVFLREFNFVIKDWVLAIVVLFMTVLISIVAALIIRKVDLLNSWLTPRDAAHWPPTSST